jgi:hypothetical protein
MKFTFGALTVALALTSASPAAAKAWGFCYMRPADGPVAVITPLYEVDGETDRISAAFLNADEPEHIKQAMKRYNAISWAKSCDSYTVLSSAERLLREKQAQGPDAAVWEWTPPAGVLVARAPKPQSNSDQATLIVEDADTPESRARAKADADAKAASRARTDAARSAARAKGAAEQAAAAAQKAGRKKLPPCKVKGTCAVPK